MKSIKAAMLFVLLATGFVGVSANAYLVPEDRYNPPRYPERPGRPERPDYPDYPDYDREIVRSISIQRTISNDRLPLRRLLDLDSSTRGLTVESVVVLAEGSRANAELQLLINGRVEDYQRVNSNYTVLQPRANVELGTDIHSLQLDVRGSVYIRTIEVRLSSRGGGGYNPNPGAPFRQTVPVYINRTLFSNSMVNLMAFVDTRRLEGYSVEGMIIYGRARYRTALIDVMQNGRTVAETVNLAEYSSAHRVFMRQQVPVGSYYSLDLLARGDSDIERVDLQLVRARR